MEALNTMKNQDAALIADWLAQQFLTPPDVSRVQAMRSVSGQLALKMIGDACDCKPAIERLQFVLSEGAEDTLTAALQHRYATLFEGLMRRRSVQPFASLWDGTGRLFGPASARMQTILRQLDVHGNTSGNVPADHLGIQLAALAEALRQEQSQIVQTILAELDWASIFAKAVRQQDDAGFYGQMAQVLTAFLENITQDSVRDLRASPTAG